MKLHHIKILALLVALGCVPADVRAIGISASPATLSIKTTMGKEGMALFIVSNPSTEVGLFETYPEEFERFITLVPSRFVLEAGEKREVLVRTSRREVGIIRTAIAIEAQQLGIPSLGVGGGVRLPLSLEVVGRNPLLSAVSLFGVAKIGAWFLLGALTALLLFRQVSLSTLKRRSRGSTL